MKICTILDQIDLGSIALPEFQRGYVWNRDQVRQLLMSLYRHYPVGSLLVWTTKSETANARGEGEITQGSVKLLLDGQQRITTLYGIIRGRAPRFFDGNEQTFTGIYFHLDDEVFEFYLPMKMKDNPLWINVTELMQIGAGEAINRIVNTFPDLRENLSTYINHLNAIDNIKNIDLHIDEVSGEDKTVDVVVDIFNRVNSGGTKLSKGDLALAKICAEWPAARDEMKRRLEKWKRVGFHFKLEWLLRNINTIITGESLFSALKDVDTTTFKDGLEKAEYSIDTLLNIIGSRLGLDHDRVLGSRSSLPLLSRYLMLRGGKLANYQEQGKMLYWYIHTFLWGRYAGSTESILNQDLALIEQSDGALDRLIGQLRQNRGELTLHANDFLGWSKGARFYPLLYMLTRVWKAQDWETGVELSSHLLGKLSTLQVHHIFPKALLYKYDYQRAEVNAIANFTFLTQSTNLQVSDRHPSEYLAGFAEKHPGVIESHWIPMGRELWKPERYLDFLAARRQLLADAANEFLDTMLTGSFTEQIRVQPETATQTAAIIPGGVTSEEEEILLLDMNQWVVDMGLPEGEFIFEVLDESTGQPLGVFDLAWPNGLQEGLSEPVALLIDEGKETEEVANKVGYRFFTDPDSFRNYVKKKILVTN